LVRDLAQAESLRAAGQLPPARALAEDLAQRHPDDPAALTMLGRIWLDWPVFGRYRAESLLARAGTLAPRDPESFYYLAQVGLTLGGDDGESIARRGLVRVLALSPDYRDAWDLWTTLYRGNHARSEMVDALARHAGAYHADLWRAELLLELRRYARAMPLLDSLWAASPDDPVLPALLARAHFEQGQDRDGERLYGAALARVAADTGNLLWHQARSIATPEERNAYAGLAPEGREAFLRLFWAQRNPDLRDSVNRRLGEHFRRLAEAHQVFALLHPQSRWHHSRLWRTLQGGAGASSSAVELGAIRAELATIRQPRAADPAVAAGIGPRLDDSTQQTLNLEDGLDDRGRILVRYGYPSERYFWGSDAETWRYNLPQGQLQVTFVRRTSDGGGDHVVTPVVAGEADAARYLLRTDRPSLDASLQFVFWPAEFRVGIGRATEVVLFPDRVSATAVLYDTDGREAARDSATGRALHLVAPPGRYVLAMDAERGGDLGRFRGSIPLTHFTPDSLAVSSLLVSAGDVPPSRPRLEEAAPPTLVLPAGRALRIYGEVYGLGRDSGATRYDAVYRFARARSGLLRFLSRTRVTSVAFSRVQAQADPTIETLVVDPGRLPRGHYFLTLEVRDAVRGTSAASATIEFDLR
jgi:tetratricopeptide (TPR) repeat protein